MTPVSLSNSTTSIRPEAKAAPDRATWSGLGKLPTAVVRAGFPAWNSSPECLRFVRPPIVLQEVEESANGKIRKVAEL